MPSMKVKKTNYESTGFVRRLMKKGSSFKSLGGESLNDSFHSTSFGKFSKSEGSKWRPRKNQFELLDEEDDESLSATFPFDSSTSWNIAKASSSAESDIGEYRRDIMFEQKISVLKKIPVKKRGTDKKRELLSPIKPPSKDTTTIRAPTSSTKKTPQKKQTQEIEWGEHPQDSLTFSLSTSTDASDTPFLSSKANSFGFESNEKKNNEKTTISRFIEKSTKSHKTHPHSSYNSVTSDPTDFFSKEQATKLTMGNLVKMNSNLDTTSGNATATAKNNSSTDGMEKLVKERKFYQFAVDEDKASTIVESTIQLPADYPGGDYSIDDDTEVSLDETSQGTRIQQRSVTSEQKQRLTNNDFDFFSKNTGQDILPASSHSRKHAIEVKEFDAFFPSDMNMDKNQGGKNDAFFPRTSIDKDGFFPGFGGAKESQNAPPPPETDISSFGGDYFDPRHLSASKSLAYSVSPENRKKSFVLPQKGRQPLSSKNSHPGSGKKNYPFQTNTIRRKSNQGNEWFLSENVREQEAHFQSDDFPRPPSSQKKKRHSSISSSNFQPPPADPFDSSPNRVSSKENFAAKPNKFANLGNEWGVNQNKQHQGSLQSNRYPLRKSNSESESDDDDSFDDINKWERPAPTSIGKGVMASQNRINAINRARLTRQNQEFNRPSRNQYIDDCDDDAQSASGFSVEKVSRTSLGSRSKPMGLPNNAIVASMLFQTRQHGIDQNDVQKKIRAFEKENSRERKVRTSQGGIPDSVNTDDDYMTTISSFSDATSAYMQQESWRKPSRDLLNHFTSARALDMEYRRMPVRIPQIEQKQHLFEA